MNNQEVIKELLELAETSDEANKILEDHAGLHDTAEKLRYVRDMYTGIKLMRHDEGACKNQILEADYLAMLATIIDLKWR